MRLRGHGPLQVTWRLVWRVATKSWNDSIFGRSATAAFWQTLSLPPLLIGLLGSIGYVGGWFGPDTLDVIEAKIIAFSRDAFSEGVVDQLIAPTVADVLQRGRIGIVSVGFVLSLWAGSSAMATFVDSIVLAHGQKDWRNPVWQRIFALLLYVMFLVTAVFVLPVVALGPTLIARAMPADWHSVGSVLVDYFYYPAVALVVIVGLTTLYKLALHTSLPWHRLLGGSLLAAGFFIAASAVLRRYLGWVASTGVSYGALASTIAFLLFTFFLGFAVILGAEFNAVVQEFWPARATRIEQMRDWLTAQANDSTTIAMATGPLRTATDRVIDMVRGENRTNTDDETDPGSNGTAHPDPSTAPTARVDPGSAGSGPQFGHSLRRPS
ncbi:YihY/virulence factor BrkB family protein [Aldersonia sp. NBC_00410]|uniref:YihY/virulence factor BrkB family protein n=1 Tax=Aldersonia sp. NBC_00410 TaxID=2975954 RepID=UPI0022592444|nr:YihY/virulence factor BrkB family protein [Aldersonia sp. NBC_00410]MCX5042575.1 YihY/virulence factor BrkB family protein [Aldersonia sp. NBC_00410]